MGWLISLGVQILEAMFIVGAFGSVVVLVLSAISETKAAVSTEDDDV